MYSRFNFLSNMRANARWSCFEMILKLLHRLFSFFFFFITLLFFTNLIHVPFGTISPASNYLLRRRKYLLKFQIYQSFKNRAGAQKGLFAKIRRFKSIASLCKCSFSLICRVLSFKLAYDMKWCIQILLNFKICHLIAFLVLVISYCF